MNKINSYLGVALDKLQIQKQPYRPYHHHIYHQQEVEVVGKLEGGLVVGLLELEGGLVGQVEVLVGLLEVVVVEVVHQELVPVLGEGHQGLELELRHLLQLGRGHLLLLAVLDLVHPDRLDPAEADKNYTAA